MATSARFKFTATLLVSVAGFVLTLIAPYEADIGEQPFGAASPVHAAGPHATPRR